MKLTMLFPLFGAAAAGVFFLTSCNTGEAPTPIEASAPAPTPPAGRAPTPEPGPASPPALLPLGDEPGFPTFG